MAGFYGDHILMEEGDSSSDDTASDRETSGGDGDGSEGKAEDESEDEDESEVEEEGDGSEEEESESERERERASDGEGDEAGGHCLTCFARLDEAGNHLKPNSKTAQKNNR